MILTNVKSKVDVILKWILVFIMAGMTLNVLWQVFSRFILQNPSSITEELARYMLIWLGILGASYVAGQKMHLAIDLLSTKLNTKNKSYLEITIQVFVLLFAFFLKTYIWPITRTSTSFITLFLLSILNVGRDYLG